MTCSCVYVDHIDCEASVFTRQERVARRRHKCTECGHAIDKGTRYTIERGLWDGKWGTYKTCSDCLSIRDEFFCEGYIFTEVWEYLSEHVREIVLHGEGFPCECLTRLTPRARRLVCEHIESIWSEMDERGKMP